MKIKHIVLIGTLLTVMGCSNPSVPEVFTDSKALPNIYPDYINVGTSWQKRLRVVP